MRTRRRHPIQAFLSLSLVAVLSLCFSARAERDVIYSETFDPSPEPYLAVYTPPFVQQARPNSVVLAWRTMGHIKPVVRFGPSPEKLERSLPESAIRWDANSYLRWKMAKRGKFPTLLMLRQAFTLPQFQGIPVGTYHYEARFEGLAPGKRYYYEIRHGERRLFGGDHCWFQTLAALNDLAPRRYWVVGNALTGGLLQTRVHAAMRKIVEKESKPLSGVLYVGDMYAWRRQFGNYLFFQPYAGTLSHVSSWPAGDPYTFATPAQGECGGVASSSKSYYAFEDGPVHFLAVDSMLRDKNLDTMLGWIERDLDKVRRESPRKWRIAFLHHAPFPSADRRERSGNMMALTKILPILDAGGVDLVLVADRPYYARTRLVRTDRTARERDAEPETRLVAIERTKASEGKPPSARGFVLTIVGNGGHPAVAPDQPPPLAVKTVAESGSLLLDISPSRIACRMIDMEGDTADTFAIERQ